ncbi:MAG: SUF system NifU family Fe-S cluster assembly protein [Bacilli bacterium]|nr:SUF system NifU family Fe-S cluster assembly protein [Bacilli bacterium]
MVIMDTELKRTIILENYQNPTNKGLIEDDSYKKINTNSKSCIDQIDLQIKVESGIVRDIRFDGEACAICTSSTSIMINSLIGKEINEALNIIDNFEKMINEQDFDEELLGEAIVYNDISKQPNRKNCALLTWKGTKKVLEEEK